jgi:hypothetical protein
MTRPIRSAYKSNRGWPTFTLNAPTPRWRNAMRQHRAAPHRASSTRIMPGPKKPHRENDTGGITKAAGQARRARATRSRSPPLRFVEPGSAVRQDFFAPRRDLEKIAVLLDVTPIEACPISHRMAICASVSMNASRRWKPPGSRNCSAGGGILRLPRCSRFCTDTTGRLERPQQDLEGL